MAFEKVFTNIDLDVSCVRTGGRPHGETGDGGQIVAGPAENCPARGGHKVGNIGTLIVNFSSQRTNSNN